MERPPENIEARGTFELKPAFENLATVRALGAIAIRGYQRDESVDDRAF
jgi:hypothetical protein